MHQKRCHSVDITRQPVVYYNRQVAKLVEGLPSGIFGSYAAILETLEKDGPLPGMPHVRSMGGGLYEIRAKGREGIARLFYCFVAGGRIVVLHGFIKKTAATPHHDLILARCRLKEVQS